MAEESEIDSDEEVVNSWGLRQSLVLFWVPIWDQNHYDFTVDTNRSRFIGCDKKDQRALIRYWAHFDNFPIMIERVFLSRSLEMSPNIKYYSEEEYPHRDFALSCGIRASFCFFIGDGIMEIVSTRNQDIVTLDTFFVATICKPGVGSFVGGGEAKIPRQFSQFSDSDSENIMFKDEDDDDEKERVYVLEFYLPSQETDNDYPHNWLNSTWTTVRESLLNTKLAPREREKLGPVLSFEVINSSIQTEPTAFEIGHPQSSLPHYEGSEFTRTSKWFEKCPDESSNSNSYEEAAVGETSVRTLNEASHQLRRSEEYFKTKRKTLAAERDNLIEVSLGDDEDVEPMTSASKQLKKSKMLVTHSSRDFNMMTVKVTYDVHTIKFELPSSSGLEELENSVIERLHLDRKSFSLRYQDDEDDCIDIICDEDVQEYVAVKLLDWREDGNANSAETAAVMSSYLEKDQLHLTYGIGVGLESMTINSMRWDGTVNSRVAQNCLLPMAVASRDGVTRLDQDQAAVVDLHKKASAAAAAALGRFKDEIVHVHTKIVDIKNRDEKPVTISVDDVIRANIDVADLGN
ncbi:hypothetical protein ACET3Z_032884 [Daucus carota]